MTLGVSTRSIVAKKAKQDPAHEEERHGDAPREHGHAQHTEERDECDGQEQRVVSQ
jgi:hypothetical protein